MHSLVLSQGSEIPHKLSSDIQELLCSWATICTGASSCQYRTILWYTLAGPFFPVHSHKKLDIKRPHCTSCQDQIDQVLIWQGPFKNEESPRIEPCGTPQRAHSISPTPSWVSSRQDLPRSQCSLEKMSLVGRSRHDFKTQAREELWFELSHTLSSH